MSRIMTTGFSARRSVGYEEALDALVYIAALASAACEADEQGRRWALGEMERRANAVVRLNRLTVSE